MTLLAMLPGVGLSSALVTWNYSDKPLWRDEWFTYSTVERPLSGMLGLLSNSDGGLSGFYLVMHVWMLLGDSVAWLRLPAALCTVGLCAAVAVLGRRLHSPTAGAVSGLLMALLPAVIEHQQEARAYPLVLLATTAAGLAALRCRDDPTRSRWMILGLLGVVAASLHPLPGAPAIAGIFAGMLVSPGKARRVTVLIAGLPAGLVSAALVAAGLVQQGVSDDASPGGIGTVLLFRYVLTHSWSLLALFVALALVGAGFLLSHHRGELIVLVAWVALPLAVMSTLTVVGSFFKPRYVSTTAPVAAVLIGVGVVVVATTLARLISSRVGAPWAPRVRIVGIGLLAAVVLIPLVPRTIDWLSAPYRTDDPRSAARAMAAGWGPGDEAVYVGSTARGLITFYAPARPTFTDPLLSVEPLQSSTVGGVEVARSQRSASITGQGSLWVVGESRDGGWGDPAKVTDVTAGRARAEHHEYGKYWLERWDVTPAGS